MLDLRRTFPSFLLVFTLLPVVAYAQPVNKADCVKLTKTLDGIFSTNNTVSDADDFELTDNIIPVAPDWNKSGLILSPWYFVVSLKVENCGTSDLTGITVVDKFSNESFPFQPDGPGTFTLLDEGGGTPDAFDGFDKEVLTWTVDVTSSDMATLTVKVGTENNPSGKFAPTSEDETITYNGGAEVTVGSLSASVDPIEITNTPDANKCVGSVGAWDSLKKQNGHALDKCGKIDPLGTLLPIVEMSTDSFCADASVNLPFWDGNITNNGDGTGEIILDAGKLIALIELGTPTTNLALKEVREADGAMNVLSDFVGTGTISGSKCTGFDRFDWTADPALAPDAVKLVVCAPEEANSNFFLEFTDCCDQTLRVDPALSLYSSTTAIDKSNDAPLRTGVAQNYPNPFRQSTSIRFDLVQDADVSLIVYDILGREVASLVDGSLSTGTYITHWNGKDVAGASVSSGVYLFRLIAGSVIQTRQMTLLK